MEHQDHDKQPNDEREQLQADLSCLVDGELDDFAAARVLERLEGNPDCAEFFETVRAQVRAHRDLSQPEFLQAQVGALVGAGLPANMETRQLLHRLATIFYQLGKAYTLAGTDADWRQRVFERAISIDTGSQRGRGFFETVEEADRASLGGVDWRSKRNVLNGVLDSIEAPLKKARRLLEESLALESDHEYALLYIGYLDLTEAKVLAASKRFLRVFEDAIEESNRGHAAMQLGRLHIDENNYLEALRWFRWVGISGLADQDERFFPARFNVGLCYVNLGQLDRAVQAFRTMLDAHPEQTGQCARFFADSPELRATIDARPGFAESLHARCPELFRPDGDAVGA